MILKSLFLVSVAVFALNEAASANTCTDITFTADNAFRQDSSYFKEYENTEHENEWSHKYIYKNDKLNQMIVHFKDGTDTIFFYQDTNETVLKNKSTEFIESNCSSHDTICSQLKFYQDGQYKGVQITKKSTTYANSETIEGNIHRFSEIFFKHDTVLTIEYFDYGTDSVRTNQEFLVADPDDDSKCYEYENDKVTYTHYYIPNDKGFSIKIKSDNYFREFFYTKPEKSTSIRKTLKPVKISPKARYFDLLGRYKFSK